MGRLGEVARVFLWLGTTAFGGPAAHIALMRDEVVVRRRWLEERRFLDLLAASNLIPGPSSTELAIHIGHARAGWAGLLVAGACFIVPAVVIVLVLAWAYVRYGETPEAEAILYGIEPVVVAIVSYAIVRLGRTALDGPFLLITSVVCLALYAWGINELVILFGAAVLTMVVRNAGGISSAVAIVPFPLELLAVPAVGAVALDRLFVTFLKFGSVVYGSGYVLFAFLHGDLVERMGWLTTSQLVDAVAIGQMTPGPLFTTATFIGYVLGGTSGALVATAGIFIPSFVFVAITFPLVTRVHTSPWARAFLDGATAAALALMAGVTWQLGRDAIVDGATAVLAAASLAVLVWTRVAPVWLLGAGALLGGVLHATGIA
jgi:chromate transporter